jgi:hypothetical protein
LLAEDKSLESVGRWRLFFLCFVLPLQNVVDIGDLLFKIDPFFIRVLDGEEGY